MQPYVDEKRRSSSGRALQTWVPTHEQLFRTPRSSLDAADGLSQIKEKPHMCRPLRYACAAGAGHPAVDRKVGWTSGPLDIDTAEAADVTRSVCCAIDVAGQFHMRFVSTGQACA